jgi:hypothetical protein
MRLLDRILAEGFQTGEPRLDERQTRAELEKAQLVVIDNVAAYYHQEAERKRMAGGGKIAATDFPNVMLPFDSTFLDMRLPMVDMLKDRFAEVGLLMQMFPAGARAGSILESLDISWTSDEFRAKLSLKEEVTWSLVSVIFARDRWTRKIGHIGTFAIPVNSRGQIVSTEARGIPWIANVYLAAPGFGEIELLNFLAEWYLFPAFLALSFIHCRNVKVAEERPPEKLSKKHAKKTGRPLLRYRMLQIDHMKEILERVGKASANGLKLALHICRGHFNHYGENGKGLFFGKYEATVWVPMQTRGTKKRGVVVKDYDVK